MNDNSTKTKMNCILKKEMNFWQYLPLIWELNKSFGKKKNKK